MSTQQVERKRWLPPELREAGWKLEQKSPKGDGGHTVFSASNEALGVSTGGYDDFEECKEVAEFLHKRHQEKKSGDASCADATADEADRIIEEAKESPGAKRTEAVASAPVAFPLSGQEHLQAVVHTYAFEPYTSTLPESTVNPEVAIQMRDGGLNMFTVAEYAEAMRNGAKFPPADVFFDGETLYLAGGAHRHAASIEAGGTGLLSTVRPGTKRDALIFAAGENATHGMPRSNADKRRAVSTLLEDEEWVKKADGVIAKHAGVSQPFVSHVREDLELKTVISPQAMREGADGVVRDVTKIGGRVEPEPAVDERQSTLGDIDGVQMPEREPETPAEPGAIPLEERVCRKCFCTEDNACEGGCTWVEDDLCSKCQAQPMAQQIADGDEDYGESPEDIALLLSRHNGVLYRMQLEEMGISYEAILNAVSTGAIAQPETGKFTLPDHKPQPSSSAAGNRPASSPAPKPKPSIQEILKGRFLSVSFTFIPATPNKVSVAVNATVDKMKALRGAVEAVDIRGFSQPVMDMIFKHLEDQQVTSGKKKAIARVIKKATKKPTKRKVATKKPAKKKARRR